MKRRNFFKISLPGLAGLNFVSCTGSISPDQKIEDGKVFERQKQTEISGEYDLVVCGAGPAGVCAAITAARSGVRILLIEVTGCLGGTWTAGLLSWILDWRTKDGLIAEITGNHAADCIVNNELPASPYKHLNLKTMRNLLFLLMVTATFSISTNGQDPWYTQGDFTPESRMEFTISNPLDIDRQNCAVIIPRENFPIPDLHEIWVTVVDPEGMPFEGPSEELLRLQGGHQLREETNGHAIYHQMDDLDKDGIWDEIFFQMDIPANSSKTIFIYLGENIRGWNKHFTHANIGSYCRHQMPFWESENVGWKIWFANCCDVFAKRKPVLMSNHLYMDNYDGYGVSLTNEDWGSDIQGVAGTLGGGGICLFESPDQPEAMSLPRFTPVQSELAPGSLWNAGQISDTRYAYEVLVNGPVRSIIKIKGMNWDSGNGYYEYEQLYTVYAKQSYCTSRVTFTSFQPKKSGVMMGCGFKKKPQEDHFISENGMVISSGPEGIRDPEKIDDREDYQVDFIGSALMVKDTYQPEYQFTSTHGGNHTFKVTPHHHTYEFMLASAWSEGAVYNNKEDFTDYIRKTHLEYNNPLKIQFAGTDEK